MTAISDSGVGAMIGCGICFNLTVAKTPATTIVEGYSVCGEHAEFMSRPFTDFAELMRRVKTNATEQAT